MRRYLKDLGISYKILISSLVFAAPLLILLYYLISGFNHMVSFSKQEIWGMRVVEPLASLSELVSEHQLLVTLAIEGNRGLEERIKVVEKQTDEAFATLMKEGKRLEAPLKISEKHMKAAGMERHYYPIAYSNWERLKGSWKSFRSTSQNDGEHETVLQTIHVLIKRVADTSNMVLDPDLVTTYLIAADLQSLPKTQERLSSFVLYIKSLQSKGFQSQEDMNRLTVYSAFLESELQELRETFSTVLEEGKNYYGGNPSLSKNIPPALEEYELALVQFLIIGKRMAYDSAYTIPAPDLLSSAQQVMNGASNLKRVSMGELKILLDKRIAAFRKKGTLALSLTFAGLFFAVTMVFFITRGITRSLRLVADIAGEIAAGNLQRARESLKTIELAELQAGNPGGGLQAKPRNEILQLFHAVSTMTTSLDALLAQVRTSGVQVTASSAEIAASARELEATVAEQAASINQVSITSREISSTAQDFAARMNEVTEMATDALELAAASMTGLADINVNMKALLDGTAQSTEKLNTINEKMGNISQVITTITKVANQINLLSLNAAIEAEKAGEYGIGFSVVAREIRRLADQTAVAAIEIEATITETQASVRDGVSAVAMYANQTKSSTENISDISARLERVMGHTTELKPHLEAVNHGMQMQSDSAGQISEAMSQLNDTARQTRDSLVEFKRVTQQLNDAARGLQDEVMRFTVSS